MNRNTETDKEPAINKKLALDQKAARKIIPPVDGDCDLCGSFGRLVEGACSYCRKKYKI